MSHLDRRLRLEPGTRGGRSGYRPGERVLDVGCGCGDLSVAAGRAVTATGEVLGVDLSPAMLGVAADRVAAAGLDHVAFTVADAADHRPDPAGFDVMVSRFGVMFFDDPAAAFIHPRSLMTPGAGWRSCAGRSCSPTTG